MQDFDTEDHLPASPLLAGAALLGVGLLLRNWRPSALELPEPDRDGTHRDRGARRAARHARDGAARIMPRNLTRSVARSLIVVGAALVMVRALDELVEEEESLF